MLQRPWSDLRPLLRGDKELLAGLEWPARVESQMPGPGPAPSKPEITANQRTSIGFLNLAYFCYSLNSSFPIAYVQHIYPFISGLMLGSSRFAAIMNYAFSCYY